MTSKDFTSENSATVAAPRVTLAMPVYNGERYMEDALRSMIAQDFDDLEILINDNASTDRTAEIAQDYAARDPRVRHVRNETNLGAAPNYDKGLELARGEFLKWCAHDDTISPNFVSACVAALDAEPAASMAFGRVQCIDSAGEFIDVRPGAQLSAVLQDDAAERFHYTIMNSGACYPIFGLFRTEALRKSLGHQPYYGSDRALLAEMALLGKMLEVEEAVAYNRDHDARSMNMTDQKAKRRWQSAKAGRWANSVEINQFRQFAAIARRHGDVCEPRRALGKVAKAAFSLRQFFLFGIDALRWVSPSFAGRVRDGVDDMRATAGRLLRRDQTHSKADA